MRSKFNEPADNITPKSIDLHRVNTVSVYIKNKQQQQQKQYMQ